MTTLSSAAVRNVINICLWSTLRGWRPCENKTTTLTRLTTAASGAWTKHGFPWLCHPPPSSLCQPPLPCCLSSSLLLTYCPSLHLTFSSFFPFTFSLSFIYHPLSFLSCSHSFLPPMPPHFCPYLYHLLTLLSSPPLSVIFPEPPPPPPFLLSKHHSSHSLITDKKRVTGAVGWRVASLSFILWSRPLYVSKHVPLWSAYKHDTEFTAAAWVGVLL